MEEPQLEYLVPMEEFLIVAVLLTLMSTSNLCIDKFNASKFWGVYGGFAGISMGTASFNLNIRYFKVCLNWN
jgi:hypothetical protein